MDPAAATEHPLPGRRMGSTCLSRCRRVGTASRWTGWRGGGGSGTYICAQDCDVLQVTEVRPQWSGGERSRRSESTFPTPSAGGERDRIGRAQRLRGRGRAGLRGQGSGWLGGSARGLGVPGASLRHPSVDGPHRGTQVTRRTRVGQYARLWWESQGTSGYRRGVLDVGRVR